MLELDQVGVRFGGITALRNVTARLDGPAAVAVLGPNASGKTTLLRCLAGVLRPTTGSVRLDGRNLHRLRARALARRLAYVPQQPDVAAGFTVQEVVRLGRYGLAPDDAAVARACAAMELEDVLDRPFPQLSGGQQQRTGVARALAQIESGGLLLLDEPTAAMDLHHVRTTARLIPDLVRRDITVIFAMHDVALALALADVVWLLDAGRLVDAGPATEVATAVRLAELFRVPFATYRGEAGRAVLLPRLLEAD